MRQPEIEIFKVWPTFPDRSSYRLAMSAIDRGDLRKGFPYSFTQQGTLRRIGIDHPPALEAIWYFADEIARWVAEGGEEQKAEQNMAPWLAWALAYRGMSLTELSSRQLEQHKLASGHVKGQRPRWPKPDAEPRSS